MAITDRSVEGRSNSMFRRVVASRVTLSVLVAFTLLALAFLALVALHPALRQKLLPSGLEWFGEPGSWLTITIVVAAIVLLCVGTYWSRREDQSRNVTVMIVAGLTAITLVMGLSAFWQCNDEKPPTFFTPLMWTLTLMRGSVEDHAVKNEVCPSPVPVALDVARLSALGAILVGVAGVVIALLASQVDRIRVRLAKSVTVVVGIDDDAQSMVTAVARTLARNSLLVLITTSLDSPCAAESRRQGARIISVDLDRPETLESLSLWKKLDRLYLMASDPTANLIFLGAISRRMSALGPIRRIPLIVRIDDPWQAEVWRAKQFGGSDTRWAADAVGKYEVTARRLLDQIVIGRRVTRILVCGTSPLTLALCADIAQRYLERSYFTDPLDAPLPTMTLVGEHAEEYRQDHEFRQEQHGLELADQQIHAVSEPPSIKVLTRLITEAGGDADVASRALIFVDRDPLSASPVDSTTSTRLAVRFPGLPIYAWDPHARVTHERLPIVGQLRTFPLVMDLPRGQAQDAWERAAMLIHERYAAEAQHKSAATRPWSELDEFYRGSNRRQVRNALWMVEEIASHTWNTFDGRPIRPLGPEVYTAEPLEQLRSMGFDRESALAMARAEHEDWCRYYRDAGWQYGPVRDDERKIHDKLVGWDTVEGEPAFLDAALRSLAATLLKLRDLGYRSKPLWEKYARAGTVSAEQRSESWTWESESGQTMSANAGDWAIWDTAGRNWSVRDDVFRTSYEHVTQNYWRRKGFVLARPARPGETIDTLEGPATTADGDWIVCGEQGEQWPVPAAQFVQRYEGPLPPEQSLPDRSSAPGHA